MEAEQKEKVRENFWRQYFIAWMASGEPSYEDSMETFARALGNKNSKPDLLVLWMFFQVSIQNGVPLTWFHRGNPAARQLEEEQRMQAQRSATEVAQRIKESITRFMNNFHDDDSI